MSVKLKILLISINQLNIIRKTYRTQENFDEILTSNFYF